MAPKREIAGQANGRKDTLKKSVPKKSAVGKKNAGNKSTESKLASLKKKPKKTIKICAKTINYSLCIPVSIIDNCKNLEQITHVVYQVAKSAVFFNAGEIVVLDLERKKTQSDAKQGLTLSPALLIASLLQYFVTPPYLVKSVFKKEYQSCFSVAAKLPRISALPFMRHLHDDKGRYREGLAIRMTKPSTGAKPAKKKAYEQTK